MRNFRRLATSLVALVLVLAFSSCEKQLAESSIIEVSFDIADLTNGAKKGALENGDPGSENTEVYPDCVDLATDYVEVTIDGNLHTLQMTSLPNSQTEVIKLDTTDANLVTMLNVYSSDGTLLYTAPSNTSLEVTQGGLVGVPFNINTWAWHKESIHVDVVCWHPFSHENYSWNWFQIDYNQLKSICFFGDVCTKFFADFGAPGYDLQADFTVALSYEDADGAMVTNTVTTTNSTTEWVNEDGALCISYLDNLNKLENATFDLTLHTPTGDILLLDDEVLAEGTWSEVGKTDGFGGDDGIYLFNVGTCGIAEDAQFPSYLPLPDQVKMNIGDTSPDNFWITITEAFAGQDLHMLDNITGQQAWCLDNSVSIGYGVYDAKVFSSLDLAKLMADGTVSAARKTRFNNLPWGAINYLINHIDELPGTLTPKQVQHAFWYITDALNDGTISATVITKIELWKTNHSGWTPKVGDDAVVFMIPDLATQPVQAFGVRIDP